MFSKRCWSAIVRTLLWSLPLLPGVLSAQTVAAIPASTKSFEFAETANGGSGAWVLLPGNTHRFARPQFDQGRAPDTLPEQHILMMLKRAPAQEQALDQFMADQYNPQSPHFHEWLTPAQFGARFGPSAAQIGQVTQWLSQQGFTVNSVPDGHTFIDFSGTAGEIASAFHTEIHHYRIAGKDYFANASDPSIPAALAPLVAGFRSLNDFHSKPIHPPQRIVRLDRSQGKWSRLSSGHLTDGEGTSAVYLVGPQDYAEIYGVNQVWQQTIPTLAGPQKLIGTGQNIAVVGDSDLSMTDIQSFRDEFGTTALGPHGSVEVDHPASSVCAAPDPTYNDPEGYLDAEWSGAMAPDATIDFVVCNDSGVTLGADLAAAYVVQDAAHVQQDPVLSTSWGYCEQDPISESNTFYTTLWQQAAAEGITVLVATGDSGPSECDEFGDLTYAVMGTGVSAEASTPYNIAVGGTDFSDVFSGTAAQYWSAANNANLQSAQSYIPEMAWNDSCASPMVLQAFGQGFSDSWGADGFCTYASQQPIDPATYYSPYFLFYAGSGGLSTISTRPSWQAGVTGIPGGDARALPDVSLFASTGYAWGHTLLLCDSGILPSGYSCDFSDPDNLYFSEAGGTSFSTPAFAGMMALIVQKNGRQGQADNILYQLAAQQYGNSSSPNQPSLATCAAYLGTGVLPSCYFHDISATPNPDPATQQQTPFLTGTTSVPCTGSATSPGVYTDASTGPDTNSEDCYGYQITVTSQSGSNVTTPNYYGIVSTADNASSPAFPATPGYDLATGLGSPNLPALINAPQWRVGSLPTSTVLTPAASTVTPAQDVTLIATVTVSPEGTAVLAGNVTFYSAGAPLGTVALGCGNHGKASLTVPGSAFGPDATYGNVYAVYSGGIPDCGRASGGYQGSQSSSVSVVVAAAVATISASPIYEPVRCCFLQQPTLLKVTATGEAGAPPTGTILVQFNGITVGRGTLVPNSSTTSSATILINIAWAPAGSSTVGLVYSGDSHYPSETATASLEFPSRFSLGLPLPSLPIDKGAR